MMQVLHRPDYFGVNVDDKGFIFQNTLTVGIEKNCQGVKGIVSLNYDFTIKTIWEEAKCKCW